MERSEPVQPAEVDERSFDDIRRALALAQRDEQDEFERTRVDLTRIGANLRRFAERHGPAADEDVAAGD